MNLNSHYLHKLCTTYLSIHLNTDDFDTMLNNKKLWSIMQYIYKILKYYIQSNLLQRTYIHEGLTYIWRW